MHTTARRITAASVAAFLTIGGLAACSDEDGDGGVSDEEIQDVEDGASNAGNEIEEEVDAQEEGSDEDNE